MVDVLEEVTNLKLFDKVSEGEDTRLINLNIVRKNYREFKIHLPFATIYAAVKANSGPGILETLNELGSKFEIATIEELDLCLSRGIRADKIIFTHPAKDKLEIEKAYKSGIQVFVSDSFEDLKLLSIYAPNSKVMIRLRTDNPSKTDDELTGFDSRFGVSVETAKELLFEASIKGLTPYGITFHIGTQEEKLMLGTEL